MKYLPLELSKKLAEKGLVSESHMTWVADSAFDAAQMDWRSEPVGEDFANHNWQSEGKKFPVTQREKHGREEHPKWEYKQWFAQTLETEVQNERSFYEEKYVFNRDQAFHRFVSMLTTVLISKTTPGLINSIVEDLTEEYKKTYYPESLSHKENA